MRTDQYFTKLFRETKRTYFDDSSKIVFFADVHRGDNSISDEFAPNKNIYYYALAYYYSKGFTYVEVGDGDELWEQPNYNTIIDAHSIIFTLLKNFYQDGRLILMCGNHNIQLRRQSYVQQYLNTYHDDYLDTDESLFPGIRPVDALVLHHEPSGQEFLVIHGHQGDLMNHGLWRVTFLGVRFLWRFLHLIGFNYAASPAKNKDKRRRMEKRYAQWAQTHGVSIICGHTHLPRFPKNNDPAYFNPGCCIHPRGITALEIEGGKIRLVDWAIRPDGDGFLYIRRRVQRASEPISYFKTGRRIPDGSEHEELDYEKYQQTLSQELADHEEEYAKRLYEEDLK